METDRTPHEGAPPSNDAGETLVVVAQLWLGPVKMAVEGKADKWKDGFAVVREGLAATGAFPYNP